MISNASSKLEPVTFIDGNEFVKVTRQIGREFNEDIMEGFRLRRFNHPNIIKLNSLRLTTTVEQDPKDFHKSIMELCDEEMKIESTTNPKLDSFNSSMRLEVGDMDLQNYIQLNSQLTILERKKICFDILLALHAVHRAGIVHCDIKPQNAVMFGNTVKLIDFGYSRYVEFKSDVRTPFYGSERKNSKRSDIYSLALVFHYVMNGKKLYDLDIEDHLTINSLKGTKRKDLYEKHLVNIETNPFLKRMLDQTIGITCQDLITDNWFKDVFHTVEYTYDELDTSISGFYALVTKTLGDPKTSQEKAYYYIIAKLIMEGNETPFGELAGFITENEDEVLKVTGLKFIDSDFINTTEGKEIDAISTEEDFEMYKKLSLEEIIKIKAKKLKENPEFVSWNTEIRGYDETIFTKYFFLFLTKVYSF